MEKSTIITYALWLFFGIFGVHHFYLRRDRHAFCMWATLGGLGLGWLQDIWRIPEYVDDANNATEYREILTQRMKKRRTPKVSTMRWLGQLLLGSLQGYLVYFATPREWYSGNGSALELSVYAVANCAAALGVYTVGNIGRQQVRFESCLIGCVLSSPLTFNNPANMIASSLASAWFANWRGLRWRRTVSTSHGYLRRLSVLIACASVYLGAWFLALYYNATVTTADGETIPLRRAARNFLYSEAWRELSSVTHKMYSSIREKGFWSAWPIFIDVFDPEGERHAYRVLGLTEGATEHEIDAAYRKLVLKWHPDKIKDERYREEAQGKFLEIQHCYESLSSIKQKRSRRHSNTVRTPTD